MRTKKNYLCVYTLFFMCLFSCGGSKNTLLELPKDIQTKYEYFIREGETISFKYPSYFDLDPSFDLAGFFKNDLHGVKVFCTAQGNPAFSECAV